jgi:hypothetical protein
MRFESPLPADMTALLAKWRAYANGPMLSQLKDEEEPTA